MERVWIRTRGDDRRRNSADGRFGLDVGDRLTVHHLV